MLTVDVKDHKFSPRFKGPYRVEKIVGSIVTLKEIGTDKLVKTHMDKIKRFAQAPPMHEPEIAALEWDNGLDYAQLGNERNRDSMRVIEVANQSRCVYISMSYKYNYIAKTEHELINSGRIPTHTRMTDGSFDLGQIWGQEELIVEIDHKKVNIVFMLVSNYSDYGLPASTGWAYVIIGQDGIEQIDKHTN
jgi:hypothetical protein